MIIELHALQSFGPSNLNRDDTGNPKEALFGGVRRARISSQAAKRAMRVSDIFKRVVNVPTGMRTKHLIYQITAGLIDAGVDEAVASNYATEITSTVFASLDKKDNTETKILVYISESEIREIIDTFLNKPQNVDIAKVTNNLKQQFINHTSAPDIAMFGRMLTNPPSPLSIDAACEVAHAISTHKVDTPEFDYFTAVPDIKYKDDSGASMLGLVAFNSATYYRHARIHWEQLVKNLDGDVDLALQTVKGFMQAFALVVPSGKKNSFVNQHAPDFLMAVLRHDNDGQSLDNAFENPIRPKGDGYMEPSIKALAEYWEQVDRAFRLSDPFIAVMNPRSYELPSEELQQANRPNLSQWVHAIVSELSGN